MLTGNSRRWLFVALPLTLLLLIVWNSQRRVHDWIGHRVSHVETSISGEQIQLQDNRTLADPEPIIDHNQNAEPVSKHSNASHTIINSLTTPNKQYFHIKMANQSVFNPNVIAHPERNDTFLVIAQQDGRAVLDGRYYSELFCQAEYHASSSLLECTDIPTALLIQPALPSTHCDGNLWILNLKIGPSDGRVSYGPTHPFIVYRAQSSYTCMGLWIQDFRGHTLGKVSWISTSEPFWSATELQRPPPYGKVEKNWFLFWDDYGQIYAHYDTGEKRVFATIAADGSAGPDLAPQARDRQCLADLIPIAKKENQEAIHQGTNALLITLCNRSDPDCVRTKDNTVIFHIFQLKTEQFFHALYEPYMTAFRSTPPFATYGVSRRPLWINGRRPDKDMFYITSMSWKNNPSWHGYLDDVLIVAFGIEDSAAAGIDFRASTLFDDLAVCD